MGEQANVIGSDFGDAMENPEVGRLAYPLNKDRPYRWDGEVWQPQPNWPEADAERCPDCGGQGWAPGHSCGGDEMACWSYCPIQVQCQTCSGTGEV